VCGTETDFAESTLPMKTSWTSSDLRPARSTAAVASQPMVFYTQG
jgi:hypothetical protein